MKNFKNILIITIAVFISSCSSIFSPVGDKTQNISSKCMDCDNSRNYYKAYGVAEIESQPRAEMATISQAKTFARSEMNKMISTRAMDIAAALRKTSTKNGDQKLEENVVELIEQNALNMLEETETDCIETKIVKRKKNNASKQYIVAKVCLKMSKKDFAKNLYSSGKEIFTKLDINYETLEMTISGGIKDK